MMSIPRNQPCDGDSCRLSRDDFARPTRRSSRGRWRRLTLLILLVAGFAANAPVNAQVNQRREYNVKVATIYGCCRHVTWPKEAFPGPNSPLIIAVYGDSAITPGLKALAATKTMHGRPIEIRQYQKVENTADCHILFVSKKIPAQDWPEISKATRQKPILIVGEQRGFNGQCGVVNFFIHDGRVRFELNTKVAQNRGLLLTAQLLSLGAPAPAPALAPGPVKVQLPRGQ
jgi:YfiR/HmsC-like